MTLSIFQKLFVVWFLLIIFSNTTWADMEAGNSPYIETSGRFGNIYVKSVPEETSGTKGNTYIYEITNEQNDKLLYTFDWYANGIHLYPSIGAVVRLGPWPKGNAPNESDFAIGFYLNGKTLKEYSTLDIVRIGYHDPANIQKSVTHYTVFKEILKGYQYPGQDKMFFDVKTHEDKILTFDMTTGELQLEEEQMKHKTAWKVYTIATQWYLKHPDKRESTVTENELRRFAGKDFPAIPQGYKLNIIGGYYHLKVILEKSEIKHSVGLNEMFHKLFNH